MRPTRVRAVVTILKEKAYEAEFGGKTRGKFILSREGLKRLLDLPRLSDATLSQTSEACLAADLVMIDLDHSFAFVDVGFVTNWRKIPVSRIKELTEVVNSQDELDDDD